MKKVLNAFLASMIFLSLVGCGSESGSKPEDSQEQGKIEDNPKETEKPEKSEKPETVASVDLTGLWVQENGNKDNYMTASIQKDGRIGVFFILEGEDTPYTYWVGTYDVPKDGKEEFTWISENTYDGKGIMASSADTKEFTYKSGKITYPISIQGDSGTITLIRGEWDTSKIPESAFGTDKRNKESFKDIEITESGWFLKNKKYVYYYVKLHNPNEKIAVEFPSFRITARDSNGGLLGTEDQVLGIIYPGQDLVFGGQAFSVDEKPNKVEFEMLKVDDDDMKSVSLLDVSEPLDVINVSVKSNKILGEIKNTTDKDYDTVYVIVLCKNAAGEVVDVEDTFADSVTAGSTTPFSMSFDGKDKADSVECYAYEW